MRWVLIGCLVIVAVDVASSLAAETFSVDLLIPGLVTTTAIYLAIAFMATRETRRVRTGALAGAIVASVDAAVWLGLTWLMGPAPYLADTRDPAAVFVGVVVAIGIGALFGLAAGHAAQRFTRGSSERL